MGYYTNYSLSVLNDRGSDLAILVNEVNSRHPGIMDSDGYAESRKWYDWETDLRELSRKYPDMLIEVTGDGEESFDFWEARFKNGDEEWHQAIMPPFITLVNTSTKSNRYYSEHFNNICLCEEFSNLAKAVAREVPELMYNEHSVAELRKRLMETALSYVSEKAKTIIF